MERDPNFKFLLKDQIFAHFVDLSKEEDQVQEPENK